MARPALPKIGISLGCPSGIGPEVVLKALQDKAVRKALTPVLFADASVKHDNVRVVSTLPAGARRAGVPSRLGGHAQLAYFTAAMAAAKAGEVDAICTAPVSKEAISRTGVAFVGHTEALASAFGCEVLMLMKGPRLSVALATNHVPLVKVSRLLTVSGLVRQLELLSRSYQHSYRKKPRIAVCGLNPHASDGGVFGDEEARVISPAIAAARRRRIDCYGPCAADGLFADPQKGYPFDVALAMFHDQGLVATKAVDFHRTVNVTLGLPVPRTSPDHGVAYDIAGKNRADSRPMVAALLEAAALAAR
jgi:4-hydroxythreonine-4-phosphate dehydrogenase